MDMMLKDIVPEGTETVKEIMGIPVSAEVSLMISIVFTLLVSGLMALTYRLCHDRVTYSRKFSIMLVMLAFISTVLLILVGGNPLISIGALGALSICRIRMNTKDPRDLGFVFWALSIGISSATCSYFTGAVCTVALLVILGINSRLRGPKGSAIVVIRGDRERFMAVHKAMEAVKCARVQSENLTDTGFEAVYELHMKKEERLSLIEDINAMEGIRGVNILAPSTKIA